ncbi:hypothetical protein IFU33_22900 (plasmid) [Pantoea agglomerans]|uniref:GAP1-N1 domain-containing protein n=1 Tax=Enterobacter agglomerans TaxID=549 RepID=UPI00177D569B|nr:hypothetical protein [Pantoea agglomerans]WLO87364.1 hypothetical protein NHB29_23020 [Pantoea agglomerans]WVJ49088.1 hypothetical protein IFU33_22900 [Pantoea agglomerans]
MIVDQCLFGYEDGHRLLASSLPLVEALSLLTELSDLAPNTIFGESEGYWTGLPVASLGRYVLMRTWPAPEMPRPGCVWTHALLIEPIHLEFLGDLSVLQSAVRRPKNPIDRTKYQKRLKIDLPAIHGADEIEGGHVVETLLSALYSSLTSTIEIHEPGELDSPLFAVWSQQWPRLRRNFRFQTAASRIEKTVGAARFDALALLVSADRYPVRMKNDGPEWLAVAAEDARGESGAGLRDFLWNYGRDVRRQRGSFRPLTEVFLLNVHHAVDAAAQVFRIISQAFPEPIDALYLKQDLMDGLVVPGAQVGLMEIMLNDDGREQLLPLPTKKGMERLGSLWPAQPGEIIALLDMTLAREVAGGKLASLLQSALLNLVKSEKFWRVSEDRHALQEMIVRDDPAFLIASESLVGNERLAALLGFIPASIPELGKFINALLCRNSNKLTDAVYDCFSVMAASAVIARMSDRKWDLPQLWSQGLLTRPGLLFRDDVLGNVSHTHLLLELAEQSGWLSPEVFKAGITPWFKGLMHAKNDIEGEDMETLGCFLLLLACHSGGEEGLHCVELFFNVIHMQLINSSLSERASKLLNPYLPDIGWFRNWDQALRLRFIVAEAFLKHSWEPGRYLTLARSKKVRMLLARTIEELPGGRAYTESDSE